MSGCQRGDQKYAIGILPKQEVGIKAGAGTVFPGIAVSEKRRRAAGHTVPSSLAGESIDLVKEDDGGSDGPRLPKHLQPSATIGKREAGRAFNRDT